MPRYNNKRMDIMSPDVFHELVKHLWDPYDALAVLLYYTGIRISEALALTPEDFTLTDLSVFIRIKRLKGSKQTEPLTIRRDARSLQVLTNKVGVTAQKALLFPITQQAVRAEFKKHSLYPHYFRLNRITSLFAQGYTIAQVRAWTGLTLNALDHYLGIVSNAEIGENIK